MTVAHRRHDMTDAVWERLRPLLPGGEGKKGRPAYGNRQFTGAVFWILRTGASWRGLPPDCGDWKNTRRPLRQAQGAGGTGASGPDCRKQSWMPLISNG